MEPEPEWEQEPIEPEYMMSWIRLKTPAVKHDFSYFFNFILCRSETGSGSDKLSVYIRTTDKKLSDKCKTCVSLWLFTVVAAQARKLQLCMMSKMTWNIHKPSTVIFFLLKVRVTKPAHCKNCYLNSYYPVAILPPYPESRLLALAVFGNLRLRSAPPAASLAVG